jgi:hypothetical protein
MRVVPRLNEEVNQEWISDKARFQYDALRYQRLNVPYVRGAAGLAQATWPEALAAVAAAVGGVKGSEMRAMAGRLADAESMVALKDLMNRLGCGDLRVGGAGSPWAGRRLHHPQRVAAQLRSRPGRRGAGRALCGPSPTPILTGAPHPPPRVPQAEGGYPDADADARSSYTFNSSIAGVDAADAILLVGCNPRLEAPVLNARIRAGTHAALRGCPLALRGRAVRAGGWTRGRWGGP